MKVTAVLLLALASASAGSLPLRSKVIHPRDMTMRQSIEGRIIKGESAKLGDIPYQLFISFGDGINFWSCGGSILSETIAMTAAHCTDGALLATIYAGSLYKYTGLYSSTVTSINFLQHSGFNTTTLENDISLIKLVIPMPFGQYINKVELPSLTETENYEGQTALVSGWGQTSNSQPSSPNLKLQKALVDVISNNDCYNAYGGGIRSGHMCTRGDKGEATCYGDSGGPLVVRNTKKQIGLVSFGSSLGCDVLPSGFTRITAQRVWIKAKSGI